MLNFSEIASWDTSDADLFCFPDLPDLDGLVLVGVSSEDEST